MSSINIFMHASPDKNLCILPGFCVTYEYFLRLTMEWTIGSITLCSLTLTISIGSFWWWNCFFSVFFSFFFFRKPCDEQSGIRKERRQKKVTNGRNFQFFLFRFFFFYYFHMRILLLFGVEGAREMYCFFISYVRTTLLHIWLSLSLRWSVQQNNEFQLWCFQCPCSHFYINITLWWAANRMKSVHTYCVSMCLLTQL